MESSLRARIDGIVAQKRARLASSPEPKPFPLQGDALRCVLQHLPLKTLLVARLVSRSFARQGAFWIKRIKLEDGNDFPAAMEAFPFATSLFLSGELLTFVPDHPGRARITKFKCWDENLAISMMLPSLQEVHLLDYFNHHTLSCIPPYITTLDVAGSEVDEDYSYVNIANRFPHLRKLIGVELIDDQVVPFLEAAPHIEEVSIEFSHFVMDEILTFSNPLPLRFKKVQIFPQNADELAIQLFALCRFSNLETLEIKVESRMEIAETVQSQFLLSSLTLTRISLSGGALQMIVYFASPRILSLSIEPRIDDLSFDHLLTVAFLFPNLKELDLPGFRISQLQINRLLISFPNLRRLGVHWSKPAECELYDRWLRNSLVVVSRERGMNFEIH